MSDYFDRVESELRLAAARRVAVAPARRRRRPSPGGVVATLSVATALAIAALAVTLHHAPVAAPTSGPSAHDKSVHEKGGLSLGQLLAHFAILRRPASAADRAAVGKFTVGVGSGDERPSYVRRAGVPAGTPFYLVVYADHRHGTTGSVVGYTMNVDGSYGGAYQPGYYWIFPNQVGGNGKPIADVSVVPDGVRQVSWTFACDAPGVGCVLPPRRIESVSVHDNLAVLKLPTLGPGEFYASAASVTWNRTDGASARFGAQQTAVPFAGAPAAPGPRHNAVLIRGDGPPAGETLASLTALYGVLRRPQDELDRTVRRPAGAGRWPPIVSSLTRVLTVVDGQQMFLTLSPVNPSAAPTVRRYIVFLWSEGREQGGEDQLSPTTTPQLSGTFLTTQPPPVHSLDVSVVPDSVRTVGFRFRCAPGCPTTTRTIEIPVRNNIAVAATPGTSSSALVSIAWYQPGSRSPLVQRLAP